MTPEEKVLEELKEKINLLFTKMAELKVIEAERRAFEADKAAYKVLIDDYKRHKKALEEREKCLNKSSQLP